MVIGALSSLKWLMSIFLNSLHSLPNSPKDMGNFTFCPSNVIFLNISSAIGVGKYTSPFIFDQSRLPSAVVSAYLSVCGCGVFSLSNTSS